MPKLFSFRLLFSYMLNYKCVYIFICRQQLSVTIYFEMVIIKTYRKLLEINYN